MSSRAGRIVMLAAMFALATSVAGWAVQPCGVANQIFCQPFDQTGNAYSSQNDPGGLGNFATVYDNFDGSVGPVHSVHWVGEDFNGNYSPVNGFTVSFWDHSGAGGSPGGVPVSFTCAGLCGETDLGNFGGFEAYVYWITLPKDFTPIAGANWLSIVPNLGFPPQWGWSSGTGGDGLSYQDFFGARSALAADMAFALDGPGQTTTPEPGTMVMLGTGILGLAGTLRRKLL